MKVPTVIKLTVFRATRHYRNSTQHTQNARNLHAQPLFLTN